MSGRIRSIEILVLVFVLFGSGCTLLEQRLQANESSAIEAVRSLNNALAAQRLQSGAYAKSVSALGAAVPNELTCRDVKCLYHGYNFEYRANGSKYVVIARPNKFGNTGRRSFFADESGVIRFTTEDRAPTLEDRPVS